MNTLNSITTKNKAKLAKKLRENLLRRKKINQQQAERIARNPQPQNNPKSS